MELVQAQRLVARPVNVWAHQFCSVVALCCADRRIWAGHVAGTLQFASCRSEPRFATFVLLDGWNLEWDEPECPLWLRHLH